MISFGGQFCPPFAPPAPPPTFPSPPPPSTPNICFLVLTCLAHLFFLTLHPHTQHNPPQVDYTLSFFHLPPPYVQHDIFATCRRNARCYTDELKEALKNMRNDIGAIILDMALYQSGLMVVKVKEIHMMYSKYNPTRAGKYINLPTWISLKNACININNKDDTCFKYYAIQRGSHKMYWKTHPENFYRRWFTLWWYQIST